VALLVSGITTVRSNATTDAARDLLEINQKSFSRSTTIDNKWMPLRPGTQMVYEGSTVEDRKKIPHRLVSTVTDLVKVIDGIPAVVVLEDDFSEGKLEERELTFFAQDDEGNVWHLGHNRETYDETELVGGRAWMVGHLKDAKAGIMVQASPREDTPSYSQGFAPPPFNFSDRARVRKFGEKITVPAGTYDGVLLIEEFSQQEAGASQLKYYAPGLGNVHVGWEGNDPKQETLDLVRVVQLGSQEMAEVRGVASKIEERAYVYGSTQPAKRSTR
jgi:hypothetical protein